MTCEELKKCLLDLLTSYRMRRGSLRYLTRDTRMIQHV